MNRALLSTEANDKKWWALLACALVVGCAKSDPRTVITIWHQSRPTEKTFLEREIARFEQANPTIYVRALYKETEELRSGFQAAALAGGGPELIYGPSDVLGALQTMGVVQDMSPWFPQEQRADSTNSSASGTSVSASVTGAARRFPIKNAVVLSAPEVDWAYAVI